MYDLTRVVVGLLLVIYNRGYILVDDLFSKLAVVVVSLPLSIEVGRKSRKNILFAPYTYENPAFLPVPFSER